MSTMKKMACLPAVLITGILLWLFVWSYVSFWPVSENVIKLPADNAVARFQTWVGFTESQPFVLRVDTPHGTTSAKLWTDWGPADDLVLYWTPEGWLVGIGGGGDSVIMDVLSKSGPRIILGDEQKKTNDQEWTFLGYAYSRGRGLVPPTERKECIALLGSGWSAYRKQYQVPHNCWSST